jgi:CHASE2 domain-containing sensor protein/nitrogen-specific signal transduction histidine kinase
LFGRLQKREKSWRGVTITILLTCLLVIFLRLSGVLQLLEWKALDFLFFHRLPESDDSRIVLVNISESDINALKEYPLSDEVFTNLLEKIEQQKPNVIGLDIFRDFPVPSINNKPEENQQAYSNLLKFFRSTPNLIGIAKITDSEAYPSVNPPSVLKKLGQVSAADLVIDDDGVVRRGNLFPIANGSPKSSIPSLGLAVALNYLATEGIKPLPTEAGWLRLRNTVFLPFQANNGGYVDTDDNGYQILLNWRSCKSNFPQVSVNEVLQERIPKNLFQGRIVLVGNQATSVKDHFTTPCSQGNGATPVTIAGVEIQANLASQIISAVLEGRPLLKVWSKPKEYLWFIFWIGTVAIWGWKKRKIERPFKIVKIILSFVIVEVIILIGSSYLLFLKGWWIPIMPTLFGIVIAAMMIIGCIYIFQLQEAKSNLESKVADRTEELELTLEKLKQFQQQLIIKEKQASLGTLSARIAHQIKNPLNLINLSLSSSLSSVQKLEQTIEENSLFFEDVIQAIFQDNEQIFSNLTEHLTDSQEQVIRVNQIIQDILSYFRQEKLESNLTDVNSLLTKIIKLFERQYQLSNREITLKIETDYDNSISQIEIISSELEKALINLLENAYYTVQNKQRKTNADYLPTIAIKTQNLVDRVEISICDNGEGISSEAIDQIFDPFWTNKPPLEGTGLGLFFVHQIIVELHKGEIKVESVVGEKSQFIVSLPQGKRIP